jgi:hypothetical protein
MKTIAAALCGAGAAGVATAFVGRTAFRRRMDAEIGQLLADARPPTGANVTRAELKRLPEPVRRWLHYSQVVGRPRPATVRLRQEGDFRLQSRTWLPFRAEQYFTTDPPGFLWTASFRMAPLVSIVGRDRYRAGEASMEMRVLSLIPVVNKTGGGLNQGDLLRYLGELQWFPAGALAGHIAWEALDADAALATMRYAGVTASMAFRFGADGRLLELRADRYNDALGRIEPWVNRNDVDREFEGIRIPAAGEARWEYESGPYPYIRWRIVDAQQDRPSRYRVSSGA